MIKLNDVIGRLTVIGEAPRDKRGKRHWLCRCSCGVVKSVPDECLRFKKNCLTGRYSRTESCGCLHRERAREANTTHGKRNMPEYQSWRGMRERCLDPKSAGYKSYGGKGVKICQEWLDSFETFLADMGPRPFEGASLGRVDNDGDYTPENCRWESDKEQARNKTTTLWIRGKSLAEWAEITGINYTTLFQRLKIGWSEEQILTTPVRGRCQK